MCAAWTFRPTALSRTYRSISVPSLFELYREDNDKAVAHGWCLPSRRSEASTRAVSVPYNLRVCQWNIHYLENNVASSEGGGGVEHAHAVADAILRTDADVVVLNEFGTNGPNRYDDKLRVLVSRLEGSGYSIHCARCSFPTAIATRLSVTSHDQFSLDEMRSAVVAEVEVDNRSNGIGTGMLPVPVTVFGTHLEDYDDGNGKHRLIEARKLLSEVAERQEEGSMTENVLLVGDFNQQRKHDYTSEEWEAICQNKDRRGSPEDDGVFDELRAAGFGCSFDRAREEDDVSINWIRSDPPPSTHWTSTLIDYTYCRGRLSLSGLYVLPSNLSDHRMVVSDWDVS